MYPLFPARPILPHLILAHGSLSLSFTFFSPQYFLYPTIFFHSPYSGLDVSIRYQFSCPVWSSTILQPSAIFIDSLTAPIPSLKSSHCLSVSHPSHRHFHFFYPLWSISTSNFCLPVSMRHMYAGVHSFNSISVSPAIPKFLPRTYESSGLTYSSNILLFWSFLYLPFLIPSSRVCSDLSLACKGTKMFREGVLCCKRKSVLLVAPNLLDFTSSIFPNLPQFPSSTISKDHNLCFRNINLHSIPLHVFC